MKLRYPCLVLDHDDTVVASTPTVNYPSFMDTLKTLRPEVNWNLEEFFNYNFEPGFEKMCREILRFSDEDMKLEEQNWRRWAEQSHPPMFEGMSELLRQYKKEGGIVCVVSHSNREIIQRDYQEQCGFEPDMIFGWELGPEKRKPHPWPLEQIMQKYGLTANQLLMVDDLKPGWQMAKLCGVPFVFAGWGNPTPQIHLFMQQNAGYYMQRIGELRDLVLD